MRNIKIKKYNRNYLSQRQLKTDNFKKYIAMYFSNILHQFSLKVKRHTDFCMVGGVYAIGN